MIKRTNIQIEQVTLERLKKMKLCPSETYDGLLNRLMFSMPSDIKEISKRIYEGVNDDELSQIAYDYLMKNKRRRNKLIKEKLRKK